MKKFGVVLISLLCSCATGNTIKSGTLAGGKIVADCAKDSAKASELVPALIAILSSSVSTWKDQFDMYAAKYTTEIAYCAAKTAVDKLTAPVQSEALPVDQEAVKRGARARLRMIEVESNISAQ